MNINNKLKPGKSINSNFVIESEGEPVSVAELHDPTKHLEEKQEMANRMIECYNLFAGEESPTGRMEQLLKIESEQNTIGQ